MDKIWKAPEIYLYSYVKQVKAISIIEDLIKKTHYNNITNLVEVFNCFFRNKQPFSDFATDNWNKEFTSKLNHI